MLSYDNGPFPGAIFTTNSRHVAFTNAMTIKQICAHIDNFQAHPSTPRDSMSRNRHIVPKEDQPNQQWVTKIESDW